ncbi:MAG: hypothetical protein IJR28_01890 [Ottowia sp.]|nr:hypothetical protein [Ottowia sp.]
MSFLTHHTHSAPSAGRHSLMAELLAFRNSAPMQEQQGIRTLDVLEYCHRNDDNNCADGSQFPSLYEDEFGEAPQWDVRQLQKILADAGGGWRRLFELAAASPAAARNGMIFSDEAFVSLDNAGVHKLVPALQTVAEHMQSRLDALIGHAWVSRPQRVEAAYNTLKSIVAYAPNWGEAAPDGSLSLSYIQFACGLSHVAISDTSMTRPIMDRLIGALARCAALEVLKDYLLKKISGYEVWLETAQADGVPREERLPVESKAKNATAAAMLLDRALDVVRMRVHVFKGMELAQSLANLKQSIQQHMELGDMEPALRERALYSVQMIDAVIAQAAEAYVPCSINCTTNIVHERAGYLEEIAFGGDELRCRLAELAMDHGYEALAMQLDAKRYCPSSQHVPLQPRALPSRLPTNMMELN